MGLPHPDSPAGRYFDWSSPVSPFSGSGVKLCRSFPQGGFHGHHKPDSRMRKELERSRDDAQDVSRSYIVFDKNTSLKIEDREGLVAQVYFATDQSNLDASDKNALLQVYNYYAHLLTGPALRIERPRVHFRLVGYADYRGGERRNLNLSSKRAETVAEYFSPLKKSPNFSQGIVAMGESEQPQTVTPGRGSISAQLNHYRRVDVLAKPVLTKVPTPPTRPASAPTGSRYWAIRLVDSVGVSVGLVGAYTARLEIVDMTHHMAMIFRFKAVGASKGMSVGASIDSSKWQYVTVPQHLTFDDFVGHADHIGESVACLYGYSVDRFVLHGPLKKGGSVYVKYAGWGRALSFGIDVEGHGSLSKALGPYSAPSDYMAAPPAGSDIRVQFREFGGSGE